MAELTIQNKSGQSVGTRTLATGVMDSHVSMTSVHRVIVAEQANARQGTQKTKTRSEVRGGGRKPYKQKKTGNARQGSTRSPHYAHGAMALALLPRDYEKKVNKKERRASILGILAAHAEAGNLIVLDQLAFAAPKTKDAIEVLKAFGLQNERRVLVILPEYDEMAYKSFRNLTHVTIRTAPSKDADARTQAFSARDLMVSRKIVVVQSALDKIEEVWAK
jgi:large subunit ribosomal protein L4